MNNSDGGNVSLCIAKSLEIQSFMDRFFSFLSRNKSVFNFKNRSRTGKTDDFSSPATDVTNWAVLQSVDWNQYCANKVSVFLHVIKVNYSVKYLCEC